MLDAPNNDKDAAYDFDALKVIVDRDLLERLGSVTVDYRDSVWRTGFAVTSAKDIREPGGARSCC